jgi:hypothetical protein
MRRLAALALLAAAPASADTPPAPKITSIRLDGTSARLSVRVDAGTVGPGDTPDITTSVPHRAVVTGGTAIVGGIPHKLQLVRAETANTAFDAILDADPGTSRASAVKVIADPRAESVTVDVATPNDTRVLLDFDIEMPTCFFRDARYLVLPASPHFDLAPEVANKTVAHPDELLASCGGSGDDIYLQISTREPDAPRIATIGQRLPLPSHDFAHVEIDLARELSEIPRDLATAIVIDGSRSLTTKDAEVQRAVTLAYLRAVPQSRVQLISYARDARALLPGWMSGNSASARVDREIRGLSPRNGSNLDAGLTAAGEWLSRVEGTRRVIVFTDDRISDRLAAIDAALLAKLLPEGTLVHVVSLDPSHGVLERDDDLHFAPLSVVTEGLPVRARVNAEGQVDALVLARPIELEKVVITAPGWETKSFSGSACTFDTQPQTIPEGRTCSWWGEGTAAAGPVTIAGFLWNKRVTRIVRPDPAGARTLARHLSSEDSLPPAILNEVEVAAFALNDVWALYGTWGGKGGYADLGGIGRIGFGTIGSGCGCGDTGIGDFGRTLGFGGFRLDLRQQLVKAVEACQPDRAHVEIELETTREEIVDVDVSVIGAVGPPSTLHDCVVDKVWDTLLGIPNAPAHAHTKFVI